jgi:hypothetical protein
MAECKNVNFHRANTIEVTYIYCTTKTFVLTNPAIIIVFLLYTCSTAVCQPKQVDQRSQMHFMLGNWNLHSNGSLIGESTIDTILEGHVIEEIFVEYPPDPFLGKNWTTYNPDTKQWEMTMVDNQGNHSLFHGSLNDDNINFERYFKNKKGEDRIQRLTFYNISKNQFDWTFDTSFDNGKTWKIFYNVRYTRR